MAFTLPTFNLAVRIWRHGVATTNPPAVTTVGNLCLGRRSGILTPHQGAGASDQGAMWLLVPPGTDIRDGKAVAGGDTVEVGAGTGRYYDVVWVDDSGSGFPNEHRFAELVGKGTWPTPFPTPTGAIVSPQASLLFTQAADTVTPYTVSTVAFDFAAPRLVMALLTWGPVIWAPFCQDQSNAPWVNLTGISGTPTGAYFWQLQIKTITGSSSPNYVKMALPASSGYIMAVWEVSRGNYDHGSGTSGVYPPATWSSGGPTVLPNELVLGAFATLNNVGPPSFTGAFSAPGAAVFQFVDQFSKIWSMGNNIIQVAPPSVVTGHALLSTIGNFWVGTVDCFN